MKWAGELGNPTGFIETCLKLLIALIMSLSFSLKSEKDLQEGLAGDENYVIKNDELDMCVDDKIGRQKE